MKLATGDNLKQKLTSPQKCSINVNQCLLHMYTNQVDFCDIAYFHAPPKMYIVFPVVSELF